MPTVFLVRHGRSQSNAGLATKDPQNVELVDLGHKQAQQIGTFLKDYTQIDLIVTSPYLRTQQTAFYTKRLFPHAHLTRWDVQEFTYLSPKYLGYSTPEERRPMVEAYWKRCLPFYRDGPGAETFAEFIERVHTFLQQLRDAENKDKVIVVFSHEQFINAVLWIIKNKPDKITPETMHRFRNHLNQNKLRNGAIVQMRFSDYENRWHYEKILDHLHLQQEVSEREVEYAHLKRAVLEPVALVKKASSLIGKTMLAF